MDGKRIGNFIKLKRQELALTQEQLAAEIGVERFVIENWENGEIPQTQYLIAIANVLQTRVDELLKGLDQPIDKNEIKESAVQDSDKETLESNKPDDKGYYETLNEQISNTDYGNYDSIEPHASNGFSDGERKFGFILCSIMIALVILINDSSVTAPLFNTGEIIFLGDGCA